MGFRAALQPKRKKRKLPEILSVYLPVAFSVSRKCLQPTGWLKQVCPLQTSKLLVSLWKAESDSRVVQWDLQNAEHFHSMGSLVWYALVGGFSLLSSVSISSKHCRGPSKYFPACKECWWTKQSLIDGDETCFNDRVVHNLFEFDCLQVWEQRGTALPEWL